MKKNALLILSLLFPVLTFSSQEQTIANGPESVEQEKSLYEKLAVLKRVEIQESATGGGRTGEGNGNNGSRSSTVGK